MIRFPHSDIPGSQVATHLPEAFRRYAASFIAFSSLGIHHSPFVPTIPMLTYICSACHEKLPRKTKFKMRLYFSGIPACAEIKMRRRASIWHASDSTIRSRPIICLHPSGRVMLNCTLNTNSLKKISRSAAGRYAKRCGDQPLPLGRLFLISIRTSPLYSCRKPCQGVWPYLTTFELFPQKGLNVRVLMRAVVYR